MDNLYARIAQLERENCHLSKKLCIADAMLQLQRNKSETNSMLIKNQVQDTDFIDPIEFFNFIKVKGYNEVDDTTVARCYQSFVEKGVSIPTKESIEVIRKTVGTVHHYFEEMFLWNISPSFIGICFFGRYLRPMSCPSYR